MHLRRNSSKNGLQRPSILDEVGIAVLDRLPHVLCLHLHLHHHGPLGVVGLGEHGPSAAGVGILDDGLDDGRGTTLTKMTTTSVWGRGGALPARAPRASVSSVLLPVIKVTPIIEVASIEGLCRSAHSRSKLRLLALHASMSRRACSRAARAAPPGRDRSVGPTLAHALRHVLCVCLRLLLRRSAAGRPVPHVRPGPVCPSGRQSCLRCSHGRLCPPRPSTSGRTRSSAMACTWSTLSASSFAGRAAVTCLAISAACTASAFAAVSRAFLVDAHFRVSASSCARCASSAPCARRPAQLGPQPPCRGRSCCQPQPPTACSACWRWWSHERSGRRGKGSNWTGWTWRPD